MLFLLDSPSGRCYCLGMFKIMLNKGILTKRVLRTVSYMAVDLLKYGLPHQEEEEQIEAQHLANPQASRQSSTEYGGTSQLSAAGKACIPCGDDHFSTAAGALGEAIRFASEGISHPEVAQRIATARDELNAFERIDGSPEKVAALPPQEKELMKKMMQASRNLRHTISDIRTPEDLEAAAAEAKNHRIEFVKQVLRMQTASKS